MTNNVNRIYSFLATFGKEDAWVKEADSMGVEDGVVTINEFRALIDSNHWDENTLGKRPDNDVINNFFRKFDDNHSGALKDRISTSNGSVSNMYAWSQSEYKDGELQNNVEKFVKINEVLANDTSIATLATNVFGTDKYSEAYKEWNTEIKNRVMEELSKLKLEEITDAKIASILDTEEIKKLNGEYMGKSIIEEFSKESRFTSIVEHGYDITKDAGLKSLIDNLATTATTRDDMKGEIENYLNGVDADDNETELSDGQKDLFGAELRKKLLPDLASLELYEEYKSAYISVLDEFINDVKVDATKKSDIEGKTIEDLKNSKAMGKLEEIKALQTLIENAKAKIDSDADTKIGEIFTNKSVQDKLKAIDWSKELDIEGAIKNKTILNEDGNAIDQNKYAAWLETQICNKAEKIFTNGYTGFQGVPVANSNRLNAIEKADYSDDEKLANARKAGVDFGKWLFGLANTKTAEHQKAVRDAFGVSDASGLESVFATLDLGGIKTLCENAYKAYSAVKDPDDIEVSYQKTSFTVKSGDTVNEKIIKKATLDNENITNSMTYNVTCSYSGVTASVIDGKLSFTAPTVDENEKITFTVQPMYNGQPVGEAKEITVTVKAAITKSDLSEADGTFEGKNIYQIMSGNSTYKDKIDLGIGIGDNGWSTDISTVVAGAQKNLFSKLDGLAITLKNNGFDKDMVEYAIGTTKNYYKAVFAVIEDVLGGDSETEKITRTIKYKDHNGKDMPAEDIAYHERTEKLQSETDQDSYGITTATGTSGIYLCESWDCDGGLSSGKYNSANTYKIYINNYELMQVVQRFMTSYLG